MDSPHPELTDILRPRFVVPGSALPSLPLVEECPGTIFSIRASQSRSLI
jgi:hypothetical protein